MSRNFWESTKIFFAAHRTILRMSYESVFTGKTIIKLNVTGDAKRYVKLRWKSMNEDYVRTYDMDEFLNAAEETIINLQNVVKEIRKANSEPI